MATFAVKVIKPGQVADTFYVASPNTKVKDALNAAGISNLKPDEEVFLNGKPTDINEELIPGDTVEISKKTPIVTILPKDAGGQPVNS